MSPPLFYAAEGGHEEFAAFLLANGAEVDAKNHNDVTPLFIAAQVGAASVVRLLMDKGADPNQRSTRDDVLPLYVACFEGHLDVVKELLLFHNAKECEEQGADLSVCRASCVSCVMCDTCGARAEPLCVPGRRVGTADERQHGECGGRGRGWEHSTDGQL